MIGSRDKEETLYPPRRLPSVAEVGRHAEAVVGCVCRWDCGGARRVVPEHCRFTSGSRGRRRLALDARPLTDLPVFYLQGII